MDPFAEQRSLRILHLSMLAGCALFLGVSHVVPLENTLGAELSGTLLIVGAASLVMIPVAFAVFRALLRQGPFDLHHPESLGRLRAALIMHWALIEVPCFLNLVLRMLTDSPVHAGLAVAAMAVLAFRAPTPSRLAHWAAGPH